MLSATLVKHVQSCSSVFPLIPENMQRGTHSIVQKLPTYVLLKNDTELGGGGGCIKASFPFRPNLKLVFLIHIFHNFIDMIFPKKNKIQQRQIFMTMGYFF